jgi:hypothetical protein
MINIFDKLYTSIESKNNLLEKFRFYSLLRLVVRGLANTILPLYYLLTRNNDSNKLKETKEIEGRIIVTLTSFPVRIGRLWIVIETILRQTKKPDKIVLWLSKEQFLSLDILPKKLLGQCRRGLDIRMVDGDIRSHKKYFYTLKEYPNDYMVTIDDDIFYRSTMIEDLFSYSLKFPKCVISQYSVEMSWNEDKLNSYFLWVTNNKEKEPNFDVFFGSGGGTLFPPFTMYSEILNKDLFMTLTPTADDIWLNAMCRLHKTKVAVTKYYSSNIPVLNMSNITLESINNGLNQNNKQIAAVQEYFIKNEGKDPFCSTME